MHELKVTPSSDRLRQRRKSVEITLQHLQRERREVEQNTKWMGHRAYQNRLQLLDRLTRWYHEEMGQIDEALGGNPKIAYGICVACHEPIEAERLEFDSHAELCAECQEYRETLRAD